MRNKKNRKVSHGRFGTTLAYIRWFDSAIYKENCTAEDINGYMENESSGILMS
jgi:hypothetical protein